MYDPEKSFKADHKPGGTGVRHLLNATRFSLKGLHSALLRESAFRQELALFLILLPTGAWCADSAGEFVALVCACLLVLSAELMNSAVEAIIDRVGTEYHELSGRAKDYGSAAVMMTLILVAVIWLYIVLGWLSAVGSPH